MKDLSNTKLSLYDAFDKLIYSNSLSKISITDICELCSLNRKSFYYHFEDKYDIANSFFDYKFNDYLSNNIHNDYLFNLCCFLYDNKRKYKHLIEYTGQNSFYDHIRERIHAYFSESYAKIESFSVSFYADAITFSIKGWLCSASPLHFYEFYEKLIKCIRIDSAD